MGRERQQTNHNMREIKIAREAGRAVGAKKLLQGVSSERENKRLQLSQWAPFSSSDT